MRVPPCPPHGKYLWNAYRALRNRKAGGLNGANPVEWQDVAAFVRLSGQRFAPWEINIICDIDDVYLTVTNKEEATPENPQAVKDLIRSVSSRNTGRIIADG